MATLPDQISGSPRGISNQLEGFVVESEEFNETPVQEDFDDQNGARADEKVYDTRVDLTLTVYGRTAEADIGAVLSVIAESGGKKVVYGGKTWKVDGCREAGTYNGRRRWTITAHRYDNFPQQSAS
jgi:hypothetical protein